MKYSTDFVYVKGKASWPRLMIPDPMYNKWSIRLHPDKDSLEIIRNLQAEGIKNVIKKDDDGYYVQLSRPTHRKGRPGTADIPLAPPQVVDADGNMYDGRIGNGSDVTLKLEVYSHKTPGGGKAKAARLASVRIDNLAPYDPARDLGDEERNQIRGLDEQPKPNF